MVCQNGIVCASQPLAALAGVDVLKLGGNCIDAAICTNAMLGLTEPGSNGIGGDLFAIVWIEKDKRLYGLNASGRAPYDWNLAAAHSLGLESIPRTSPLSWSVPGCVSGWGKLNERFGKLALAKCLEAAIHYAQDGFPVSPIISGQFNFDPQEFPSLAAVYHPNGRRPRYGDIFRNPLLAASYQEIATGGPAAFYEGDIAERIVAKSQALGGHMHMKDLRDLAARDSQCVVGEGEMPISGIFAQLAEMGYKGTVNLEYEIDADDPLPGMLRSFAYMRGVLDGLQL